LLFVQPVSDDQSLLARWAEQRDESAFAALVRRYVDLVYSAAARRVGERHLADDVTQAVFMILAKKAHSIRKERSLAGWLLTTVRYAAANALKMESRRQKHEQAAGPLQRGHVDSGACSSNPSDVLVWQEVAAELDDAVLKLSAADRQAILLRYFENRPVADIAAELKVSEGAARQRLSRALDKLRVRLDRRGATVASIGTAGFATLLTTNAVRAAPAGLFHSTCTTVAAAATASGVASGSGMTIAKGAIKMMTWTKLKIAAAIVTVVSVGGTGGFIAVQRAMGAERAPAASAKPPTAAEGDGAKLNKKDNMGIISVADAPPVIISTTPTAGSTDVDASGVTELKVVFSKDMEAGNFSWVQYGKNTFPKTTGKPHFEDDKRTCVLPVKLESGHPYVIWLNKAPYDSFMDTDGHKAVPYMLVFETKK
jgi:RNA polymerase sigma factor (sigma-70 family)